MIYRVSFAAGCGGVTGAESQLRLPLNENTPKSNAFLFKNMKSFIHKEVTCVTYVCVCKCVCLSYFFHIVFLLILVLPFSCENREFYN